MTELPTGWTETTLGKVAIWGSGGTPKAGTAAYYSGSIPWAVIGDLTDGIIHGTRTAITEVGLANSSAKIVDCDTVLIAMYGSIGKLGLPAIQMATNQAIAFARPLHDLVLRKYLFYYLMRTRNKLSAAGKGATQQNISQAILKAFPIPLSPLREQERIVAAIEEQFSRLGAGIAALKRAQLNLKRMRAAVLQAAVSGRLVERTSTDETGTELLERITKSRCGKRPPTTVSANIVVPENWSVSSLEAVTDPNRGICYGILMPRVREGGTVPYVEVKDLRSRRLEAPALHRTSKLLHKKFLRSQLNSGDVVLAIRGSYDRALVVPPEVAGANVSRDVARIAPLPGINPDFLAAYLMSPPGLRYLHGRARGVAVKGVNISDLRSMPIPIPSAEEQNRIVRELDRVNSVLDALEAELDSERTRSASLLSSILGAAFSGKLVSQDPRDESASIMLERIAADTALHSGKESQRGRKSRVQLEEVTA